MKDERGTGRGGGREGEQGEVEVEDERGNIWTVFC